jgi:transposase
LHIAAVTQVRMRTSAGRTYYERKTAEGKTRNEALRCLKRKLAEHLWRIMIKDESRHQRQHDQTTGPGGHSGATLQSSATGPTPTTSSSDKSLPGPAGNQPTTTGNRMA